MKNKKFLNFEFTDGGLKYIGEGENIKKEVIKKIKCKEQKDGSYFAIKVHGEPYIGYGRWGTELDKYELINIVNLTDFNRYEK